MSGTGKALENIRKELEHIATVPVYFAQADGQGDIKIGFSTQVDNRLYLLGHNRFTTMTLLGWVPGGPKVEREMHAKFAHLALGHEWFRPAPELLAFIESSTRHDEPVYSKSGSNGVRITDWGYDELVSSERIYAGLVAG